MAPGATAPSAGAGRGAALRESMKEMLKNKKASTVKAAEPAAAAPAAPAAPPKVGGEAARRGEAEAWNQDFFSRMEKDYNAQCAADGWDQIQREQAELEGKAASSGERLPTQEQIPAGSDYFSVQVPDGADRELRCDSEALSRVPLSPERPSRNLDELRRVEAATKEAMDAERARRELARSAKGSEESIRTKSDVVRIEKLDSSDDEEEVVPHFRAAEGGRIRTKSDVVKLDSLSDSEDERQKLQSAEDQKKHEEVEQAFRAYQEFQRLGDEKEARLARWRERWG